MQLSPGMPEADETPAARARSFHSKITPVFLNQQVGGDPRSAKQAVHRMADAHRLVDPVVSKGMALQQLPAGLLLDKWQPVGHVAIDLIGDDKNKAGLGQN